MPGTLYEITANGAEFIGREELGLDNKNLKSRQVAFLMMVLILTGCGRAAPPKSQTSRWTPLNPPDKIIVYKNGKAIEVAKKSKDFDRIFNLSIKRFSRTLDTVQLAVLQGWETKLKREPLGLEFVYSDEQIFGYTTNGVQPFRYNRLFFPLDTNPNRSNGLMYYAYGNGELIGPHGGLQNSNELIDLLTNIN